MQPPKQERGQSLGMEAWAVGHRHTAPGPEEQSGHHQFNVAVSTAHSTGTQKSSVPIAPELALHFHSHSLQVSPILPKLAGGQQMNEHSSLRQSP